MISCFFTRLQCELSILTEKFNHNQRVEIAGILFQTLLVEIQIVDLTKSFSVRDNFLFWRKEVSVVLVNFSFFYAVHEKVVKSKPSMISRNIFRFLTFLSRGNESYSAQNFGKCVIFSYNIWHILPGTDREVTNHLQNHFNEH